MSKAFKMTLNHISLSSSMCGRNGMAGATINVLAPYWLLDPIANVYIVVQVSKFSENWVGALAL